eukprot:5125628-Pyramimonas_sp.AAC.2
MVKKYMTDSAWRASPVTSLHSLWKADGIIRTYGYRLHEAGDDICRSCFATVQEDKVLDLLRQSGIGGIFSERLVCQAGRAAVDWKPWEDGETDIEYLERLLRRGGTQHGLAFRRGGKQQLGWREPPGTAPRRPDRAVP